eukprot:7052436-Prymnesium_polylepis.1
MRLRVQPGSRHGHGPHPRPSGRHGHRDVRLGQPLLAETYLKRSEVLIPRGVMRADFIGTHIVTRPILEVTSGFYVKKRV